MSDRTEQLLCVFEREFPGPGRPRVCRAPGRVNLLGEHIDYSGLPVLPMTLDRDIMVAFRRCHGAQVCLKDTDSRYTPAEFRNSPEITPSAPGAWDNYCKAAVQGINRRFELPGDVGMELLVSGTLPAAAGLSSSSALVVAFALAYLAACEIELGSGISRLELAALLAEAEHYVGTQGGGMDQAILLLGGEGRACKIDFNPLRVQEVPLLAGHGFVICNSLVVADKTGSARWRYNEGPLSCRLLRAMVERQAQRTFGDDVAIAHLAELWSGPLCLLDREVEDLFNETFPRPATTLKEACEFLGLPESEVRKRWIGDLKEPDGGFSLQARARHQLTEYQRVEAGRDLLLAGDAPGFGALMDASHESCARDYRVSCAELDQLVFLARQAGSLGSRLTGAGFGGCTIHLVPLEAVTDFCETMDRRYYAELPGAKRCDRQPECVQLLAAPGPGAGYL